MPDVGVLVSNDDEYERAFNSIANTVSKSQCINLGKASVMDWQTTEIPHTIRRPWRVFEEDLEDRLENASLANVQAIGAKASFGELQGDQQCPWDQSPTKGRTT